MRRKAWCGLVAEDDNKKANKQIPQTACRLLPGLLLTLFVAQGDQGVDAGGAARGDIAGG